MASKEDRATVEEEPGNLDQVGRCLVGLVMGAGGFLGGTDGEEIELASDCAKEPERRIREVLGGGGR